MSPTRERPAAPAPAPADPGAERHLDPDDPLVPGWDDYQRARAAFQASRTGPGRRPAGTHPSLGGAVRTDMDSDEE